MESEYTSWVFSSEFPLYRCITKLPLTLMNGSEIIQYYRPIKEQLLLLQDAQMVLGKIWLQSQLKGNSIFCSMEETQPSFKRFKLNAREGSLIEQILLRLLKRNIKKYSHRMFLTCQYQSTMLGLALLRNQCLRQIPKIQRIF